MSKNGYPSAMFDKTLMYFLNKLYQNRQRPQKETSTVKNYQIILPYLGRHTNRLEKRIKHALKDLPNIRFTFVYRASTRLRSLFSFKDKIPSYLRSGLIYKFTCPSCNAVYIGETKRHEKTRFCEHLGVSALTGKESKTKKESHIRDHLKHCKTNIDYDCFEIIGRDNVSKINTRTATWFST